MSVITRFAPSPTGLFHAGSYRTALFAYIFARQHGGKFILRIEDTDKERSKKEYEDNIIESLKWLGLTYDAFYRQSDRTAIYEKYIKRLIDTGHAYVSKEDNSNREQSGQAPASHTKPEASLRAEVIRFKNPNKKVVFVDLIRGPIELDTTELGDFVIAKSLTEPVFHLVNVVDDFEMGMTHIIRGEDHISNTPRQILIYEALNAPVPKFAHIPLLLAPDRSKLSKRHGALPMTDYRARGYVPEALVNYMSLLGWHPTDEKEIMSMEEILREFSLDRVQKSGAIFDEEKLTWFNRQYILKMTDKEFIERASAHMPEWLPVNSDLCKRLIPVVRDKISKLTDISQLFGQGGELGFIQNVSDYDIAMILWKKNPDREVTRKHLQKSRAQIAGIPTAEFTMENIKDAIWKYAEEHGKGDVLWPLRVALTGQEKSPDPFVSAFLIGQTESLKRIDSALVRLAK